MTRLPVIPVKEVERVLERAGFALVRQTDHRIWRKGPRTVPVPAHAGDIPSGTLRSIIRLAGMTSEEFLRHRAEEPKR